MTDVKSIREALHLTQKELAEMIGVSRNTIVNYENGGVIPVVKQRLLSDLLREAQNNSSQFGVFNGPVQNNIHGRNVVPRQKDAENNFRCAELEKEIAVLNEKVESLNKQLEEKERVLERYEKIIDKHV